MRLKFIVMVISVLNASLLLAQDADSSKTFPLQIVTVTAYKEEAVKETSLNVTVLKIDSLSRSGNYNLTDLLAKIPGVSMLSTGIGISKPVIRGLYGNRVLVLISGLKFDNQQWQDEHGLGLSDFGLAKVELIKGPMSVLYGTEAMGGIINLIEEQKPKIHSYQTDYGLKFNSNTLGGLVQVGYKVNTGKRWFRLRIGAENNADYTDGNNKRILNSRFDGYYLKSSYGFQKNKWTSINHYSGSYNRFGFIFNDIYTIIKPDANSSRQLNIFPTHLVLLNMLSSENKIYLNSTSKIHINVGLQSNQRRENEGGGTISQNMHLLTVQYLIKFEKRLFEKHTMIISNLGSFENNTNYGARKIVPDANMQESNLSVYLESKLKNEITLENGIGIGEKWIRTLPTPTVNVAGKEIMPFTKFSPYYNFFSGLSMNPNNKFNLKMNVASGVRIPNLAELSSNGLHEGIFTYETGSPILKNERNISTNIFTAYTSKCFDVSFSPFYNYFYNYVYLAPTSETWFGFPVYRYKQQNVFQYGTEFGLNSKPVKNFAIGISYAGMISKTSDGYFTPFIPAQKITPAVTYATSFKNGNALQLFSSPNYYFAQHNIALNETSTPSYLLVNIGVSSQFKTKAHKFELSVTANNLLNTAYYDHLSRFKNFGLLNSGRNIVVNFRMYLDGVKAN